MKDDRAYLTDRYDFKHSPLSTPIYQTSAYLMPDGEAFRYSREGNPTVKRLNEVLSKLEGSEDSASFSSGMGAITALLLHVLRPGMRVLIHADMFARTQKFLKEYLSQFKVTTTVSKPGTDSLIEAYDGHDLVFIESISNPILRVHDLRRIRDSLKENTLFVSDSTFATPINLKSIKMGADVAIHSGSKFLGGHNDVIAGFACGSKDFVQSLDTFRKTLGETLDPFAAFLVLRGIKTLGLRMRESEKSAFEVARILRDSSVIESVSYPGLQDHPDHDVAKSQLLGFGSVLSFKIKPGIVKPELLMNRLRIAVPANTLGGVNTTVSHPATMSHRSLDSSERKVIGITPDLYRLSIGLENPEEIASDLLDAIHGKTKKEGGDETDG